VGFQSHLRKDEQGAHDRVGQVKNRRSRVIEMPSRAVAGQVCVFDAE